MKKQAKTSWLSVKVYTNTYMELQVINQFFLKGLLKIISDCNKFLQISNPKAGPLWALGSQGMWIKSVVILAAGQRGEDFDYSKIS